MVKNEIASLRTWNSRHFRNGDGTITAKITMHPICYRGQDGRWYPTAWERQEDGEPVEILRREVKGEFEQVVDEAPYRVRLGNRATAPVRFEVNGRAVTYRARGARPGRVSFDRIKGIARYDDAFPGADLEYRMLPEGVKEAIILHDLTSPTAFSFDVQVQGATPVERNGAIVFLDLLTGEEVFKVRRPHLEDANGERGPATVRLVRDPQGQGPARLELAADAEWLADPERSWPVVLDPTTTTIQPDATAGIDTFVKTDFPDSNYGTATSLAAGLRNTSDLLRSLLRFDISSITETIVDAQLYLYCFSEVTTNDYGIGVHNVTGSWSESSVTWNTQPTHSATAENTVIIDGTGKWFNWNITTLAENWRNGTVSNNGVKLISADETVSYAMKEFYSSDYTTDISLRPKLEVTYNSAPSASPTSPTGTSTDPAYINTTIPRLSWSYSDPEGDAQANYQVVITRDSDGVVVKDTGTVASADAFYDVPAGTLAAGVMYRWKVRVHDGAVWSNYTTEQYFYTNRAPSATPIDPTGTSASPEIVPNDDTPTLDWDFSDPDAGDTQASYQVQIYDTGNVLVHDTGEVASADTFYTVPAGTLTYGTTYYWRVRVKDNHGYWSAYAADQYFQPNQTAGQPTGLNPAGTETDPAEVNSTTPRLAWTHNDPDGDPQSQYEVEIYDDLGTLIHSSGQVASANAYYDVPASTLASSTKYRWRVRTADAGSGLFGPWAEAWIYTNAAPYAPTNLSPNGDVLDMTQVQRFSWQFQDPDTGLNTDGQSAYQLIIYEYGTSTVVLDTGKVVSAAQYHDVPANTLQNGVKYQWKVMTWDQYDVAGPYSGLKSVTGGTPPTVAINSPADAGTYGKGILTAEWSYSDAEADPQANYQAVLMDAGGQVLEDSGIIGGDAASHTFDLTLANNTQYQVRVTVTDDTGQSSSDTNTFTTDFVPPPTPVLGVVADDAGDKMVLSVTNPEPGAGEPDTDYNDVWRREDGGAWIRIAVGIPKNGGYDDYAVASGRQYEYYVVAVSVDRTTAQSATQGPVSITISRGLRLHDVADPAGTQLWLEANDLERSEDWEPVLELLRFAGRSNPVAEFDDTAQEERYRTRVQLRSSDGIWAQLRALARRRATICARDHRGRKIFGVFPSLPEQDTHFGQEATIEVISTAYSEEV